MKSKENVYNCTIQQMVEKSKLEIYRNTKCTKNICRKLTSKKPKKTLS